LTRTGHAALFDHLIGAAEERERKPQRDLFAQS
jgi:hypothetical protein